MLSLPELKFDPCLGTCDPTSHLAGPKKGKGVLVHPDFFFCFSSVFLEWGQRIYICHMFPVNADALGLGHTLGTLPTLWHPL